MKILLIDNGTKHLTELSRLCADSEVEIVEVERCRQYEGDDRDAIILSGSSAHPVIAPHDYYVDEIALIEATDKPILGICLGFELLAKVYGSRLQRLAGHLDGELTVTPIGEEGKRLFGDGPFRAYEAHSWVVPEVAPPLITLATSVTGVEAFRHESKPIIGLQFHPEVNLPPGESILIWKKILPVLLGSHPQT